MTQKLTLTLIGALLALASDWIAFRKAQIDKPDVQFDWGMALSRLMIGIGSGFGIGEVTE